MSIPIDAPSDDSKNTNKTRVAGLRYQPRSEVMDAGIASQSATVGRRTQACTNAVTMPAPINGLSVVIGAANRPLTIVSG